MFTIGNLHINCDKDMYHMFIRLACLHLSGRYKMIITHWLFLCSHKMIFFLPWIKSFRCSPCKSLVSQKHMYAVSNTVRFKQTVSKSWCKVMHIQSSPIYYSTKCWKSLQHLHSSCVGNMTQLWQVQNSRC
jgi:hypothetical protein